MATHRPKYHLVKIHRSYTVEESACILDVNRNTVRNWIKQGLTTIGGKRPYLLRGPDIREFLKAKRLKNKRKCQPGEMYCLRCRTPKIPAGEMADYMPTTATLGSLIGYCPDCDTMMYRRVNPEKLEQVRGNLDIKISKRQEHIADSSDPFVNSDLK